MSQTYQYIAPSVKEVTKMMRNKDVVLIRVSRVLSLVIGGGILSYISILRKSIWSVLTVAQRLRLSISKCWSIR